MRGEWRVGEGAGGAGGAGEAGEAEGSLSRTFRGGARGNSGRQREMSFRNSSLVRVLDRRAIMVSVASSIFCCTSARRKK